VTRYALGVPVAFTEAELRRLAPVADPRRVVEHDGRRLHIYGLIDIGMALWEMARHERVMGHSLNSPGRPDATTSASPAATGRCCGCAVAAS
jgi:hypothetical protein